MHTQPVTSKYEQVLPIVLKLEVRIQFLIASAIYLKKIKNVSNSLDYISFATSKP